MGIDNVLPLENHYVSAYWYFVPSRIFIEFSLKILLVDSQIHFFIDILKFSRYQ